MELIVIAAVGLLSALVLLWLPGDKRLWVGVTIAMVWWTIARFPGFPFSGLALTVAPVANVMLILMALSYPAERRGRVLPSSAYVFPVMALMTVLHVQTTMDRNLATYNRFLWFSTVLAAVAVARAMDPKRDLPRMVSSFAAAAIVLLVIIGLDIALDPSSVLAGDYARYSPWGGNPNSIGPVLALGVGGIVTLAMAGRWWVKIVAVVAAAVTVGVLILTASRGNLLMFGFALVPTLWVYTRKRPFLGVVISGALVFVVQFVVERVSSARLERLTNLEGSRGELAAMYFQEVQERPLFGLMFSAGERYQTLVGNTLDEHNSYLRLLYIGGLSLFVPIMVVILMALWRALRILKSALSEYDRALWWYLSFIFAGMLIYGYTNRLMYEAIGAWPFVHVLILTLFLKAGVGPRVKARLPLGRQAVREFRGFKSAGQDSRLS